MGPRCQYLTPKSQYFFITQDVIWRLIHVQSRTIMTTTVGLFRQVVRAFHSHHPIAYFSILCFFLGRNLLDSLSLPRMTHTSFTTVILKWHGRPHGFNWPQTQNFGLVLWLKTEISWLLDGFSLKTESRLNLCIKNYHYTCYRWSTILKDVCSSLPILWNNLIKDLLLTHPGVVLIISFSCTIIDVSMWPRFMIHTRLVATQCKACALSLDCWVEIHTAAFLITTI